MGTWSWSSVVAGMFGFLMLAFIVILLRWAFSTRRSTARLASPSPNVDDPRLRVIEPLKSENEGLAKCAVLASHGVDAEIIRSDGRLFLAVEYRAVRAARTILGITGPS